VGRNPSRCKAKGKFHSLGNPKLYASPLTMSHYRKEKNVSIVENWQRLEFCGEGHIDPKAQIIVHHTVPIFE
jgi:dsRNA-specific ribonuclease